MAVTIPVQFTEEEATRLAKEAELRGTTVGELVQALAPEWVRERAAEQLDADELVRALRRIANRIPPNAPVIPPEQWRREHLYGVDED